MNYRIFKRDLKTKEDCKVELSDGEGIEPTTFTLERRNVDRLTTADRQLTTSKLIVKAYWIINRDSYCSGWFCSQPYIGS